MAGKVSCFDRQTGVRRGERHDRELHYLSGGAWIGRRRSLQEVRRRRTVRPASSLMRKSSVPTGNPVKSTITSARSAGDMSKWFELHGRGQEAAFGADLRERHHRRRGPRRQRVEDQFQGQEPRIAAIEETEAIAARFDIQVWPVLPLTTIVLPKNSGFQIGEMSLLGMYGPGKVIEKLAAARIEQRAIGVERAVLDRDRDFVITRSRRDRPAPAPARAEFPPAGRWGRRAGDKNRRAQHKRSAASCPACDRDTRAWRRADRWHIGIPTVPGSHVWPQEGFRFCFEGLIPGAGLEVIAGNILRVRQIPGFRVTIALLRRPLRRRPPSGPGVWPRRSRPSRSRGPPRCRRRRRGWCLAGIRPAACRDDHGPGPVSGLTQLEDLDLAAVPAKGLGPQQQPGR